MLSTLSQYSAWGVWFLQFVIGVIFIVHSSFKLKRPGNIFQVGGKLHGLVEVIGGISLIVNYQVRFVALVFSIIMVGAIIFKKFKWHTPFMAHDNTGWEFDLILLAANLFLLVR